MSPTNSPTKQNASKATGSSDLAFRTKRATLSRPTKLHTDSNKDVLNTTIASPRGSPRQSNRINKPAPLTLNKSKFVDNPKLTSSLVTGRIPTPLTVTFMPIQIQVETPSGYASSTYVVASPLSGSALSNAIGKYRKANPESCGFETLEDWARCMTPRSLSLTKTFSKTNIGSDEIHQVQTEISNANIGAGLTNLNGSESEPEYWLDMSDDEDIDDSE